MEMSKHVETADMVIRYAKVYTVDENDSMAEAVGIKGQKIIYVGSNEGTEAFIGADTSVINAEGNTVMPGLFDNHCHPCNYIFSIGGVDLSECDSIKAYQATIAKYAKEHPEKKAIRGTGWKYTYFENGVPSKEILDEVLTDRPIFLYSADYHNSWGNSKTIEVAGITKDTKDPEGGRIDRDANGEATGFFEEISCMLMVDESIGPYAVCEFEQGIRQFFEDCSQVGITSVREAGISDEPAYEAYERILKGDIPVNLFADIIVPVDGTLMQEEKIQRVLESMQRFSGKSYYGSGVKFFLDGVCEAKTGALKQPYVDEGDYKGEILWDRYEFKELCKWADASSYQIHMHAIGDEAVSFALDGLAYAAKENGERDARNLIAHIQLMDSCDYDRAEKLRIVPAMTPQWFEKGYMYDEIEVPYLGKVRADSEYPFKSFTDRGLCVTCGSDAPIGVAGSDTEVPFSPWPGLQQAITRCAVGCDPTDESTVLNPSQRVDLKTAIRAYTINAATSWFREEQTGSIEKGKDADIIILDRDLMQTAVNEIYKTEVMVTIQNGRVVYQKGQ